MIESDKRQTKKQTNILAKKRNKLTNKYINI